MSNFARDAENAMKDIFEFGRNRKTPRYIQRSKMDKLLKGHIVTIIILCFIFVDVVAVAGETMISSVCHYKGM